MLAAGLAVGGCGNRAATATRMSWTLVPSSPAVTEPATLTLELHDDSGQALTGARVRLEGHMSHPGMAPIVADAAERSPGVYVAPVAFSMPGNWVLLVTATLADGQRIEQRIDIRGVRPTA
jgi:hypothetical protein